MKRLVPILLSTLILFISLQNTFILASFKINQDYIAENLCVEKDVDESSCEGSCHLQDKFELVNTTDENGSTPIFNETENVVLFSLNYTERNNNQRYINKSIFYSDDTIVYFEFVTNCFHPPQSILV